VLVTLILKVCFNIILTPNHAPENIYSQTRTVTAYPHSISIFINPISLHNVVVAKISKPSECSQLTVGETQMVIMRFLDKVSTLVEI